MQNLDALLHKYGESHQNATNKLIHWFCVPAIVFSLMGLLMAIPFPIERTLFANWAFVFYLITSIYYLRLSFNMFLGIVMVVGLMLLGNFYIYEAVARNGTTLARIAFGIFATAWVGQFIGHKIEGKKPSFLEDVQYLLIGPAWLLHFIYQKVGIKY